MKKNIFRITLIVSLLIHLIFGGLVYFKPGFFSTLADKPKPTEIELITPQEFLDKYAAKDKIQGQIVEQNKSINDEAPKNAKYLGKENQRIEKETKAALNEKFKNTAAMGGLVKPEQKLGKNEKVENKPEQTKNHLKNAMTSPTGIKALPDLKALSPSFKPTPPKPESEDVATGGGQGPSATDDHLKDVETGAQTLLNTREFVYYSYYNRIKEKLRQYWEPKIKEKMEKVIRGGRQIASTSDKITKIVIVLDSQGILMRVQVIGPSGMQDLDEAAVEAFRAAAPFPNPPKGIIESDGTIKIRWDFILEASNGAFVKAKRLAQSDDN